MGQVSLKTARSLLLFNKITPIKDHNSSICHYKTFQFTSFTYLMTYSTTMDF